MPPPRKRGVVVFAAFKKTRNRRINSVLKAVVGVRQKVAVNFFPHSYALLVLSVVS
jgi:hypothetical protein